MHISVTVEHAAGLCDLSGVPMGRDRFGLAYPALKRRAILRLPLRGCSRLHYAPNLSFIRFQVTPNSSGKIRVSPTTLTKFASATQRGRMCI